MRRKNSAFTLAEMMTVVGIMALLTAIATPQFMGSYQRSKENSLKSDLTVVRAAVQMFYQETGTYPNALTDLTVTTAPINGKSRTGSTVSITAIDWRGPYIVTLPKDPISDQEFTYFTTTSGANLVGTVRSSMTGNDSTGIAFSTY